ncbi:hypothetical protein [Streptomyces lancefieldiae]|uniref:Uncharacterized protein n=1 Tax=Streptomyces lancefieldiae TaxID=3075520 RepID=A0ABU3B162_9ACTN|nr:hypothetical protein [Streptomyces sp. DSM 40712]MDT0615013.1 hypothetical protein [Streptomyces sp. DSM 40712]
MSWINQEATAQVLPGQRVPEDPHGNLGLSRLRRTLAWHIARRPGGLVVLAIQYEHMRTALDARMSSGYGSRERRGFYGELDVETASPQRPPPHVCATPRRPARRSPARQRGGQLSERPRSPASKAP